MRYKCAAITEGPVRRTFSTALTRLQLATTRAQQAQLRLIHKQLVAALTVQRITVKVTAAACEKLLERRIERLQQRMAEGAGR